MRAVLAPNPQAKHQVYWLTRLARGLKAHGVAVDIADTPNGADFFACWGWRRAKAFVADLPVLVVERAYLGERLTNWISLGWNGLNGRADFATAGIPDDRAQHWLSHLKPCREPSDNPVLIMGQVGGDASWASTEPMKWYSGIVNKLNDAGVDFRFRPHPISTDRNEALPKAFIRCATSGSLGDNLARAGGVITHSSNSGVDAVLAGAPTVATDEGSMVFDLVPHDLPFERIDESKRLRWLAKIAYCQWTNAEVENGTAWDHIRKGLKHG